ncbi:hypothetical protein [Variovorax sp. GT1P44]|uniref:hypothetical protein n=1 Tax=Variovorax sp. GT1P44 TaxID=3443742 RepID=UPI003F449D14
MALCRPRDLAEALCKPLGQTVIVDNTVMCEKAVNAVPQIDPAGHKKFLVAEKTRWSKVIQDAGEYAD